MAPQVSQDPTRVRVPRGALRRAPLQRDVRKCPPHLLLLLLLRVEMVEDADGGADALTIARDVSLPVRPGVKGRVGTGCVREGNHVEERRARLVRVHDKRVERAGGF